MPEYDFRCEACAHRFALRFKTYAMYDAAALLCPACKSADVSRTIAPVAIPKADRNYSKMSSQEMLSVLESGETGQVEALFKQVGGSQAERAEHSSDSVDSADLV